MKTRDAKLSNTLHDTRNRVLRFFTNQGADSNNTDTMPDSAPVLSMNEIRPDASLEDIQEKLKHYTPKAEKSNFVGVQVPEESELIAKRPLHS